MKRKIYSNLDGIDNTKGVKDIMRWAKERRAKKKDLTNHIPQAENKEASRLFNNKTEGSITWIGHSTFLIQMAGLNILTDPVWAGRMGVQKRLTEPGLPIESLPTIDIVLISHGHYDHLDFGSIKKLKGTPVFYVPIGLKGAFTKRGYHKIIEANWWDSFSHHGLKISFVPAQHWTKRSLRDTNTSHWGGWILEASPPFRSIYFVGDTGYFRGFKEIASRFQNDIVLMPIGAYEPEWFMSVSHINPEDSIKAFKELDGKLFIPMHYGAYRLADDTGPEALERLKTHWEKQELSNSMLKVLAIGETLWPDL
ncbi:L-ascorbate metabolism protein UlaG (beta-lactamase superfamily) [Peribacillus deserti]|uniref:L-ascorbate metabolism protein UlaG (Beta-lactamase superfamily) n=1 Tax=Peribacillus deserti TaxID=673318 RepID=A0ABS2QDF8_9BACI|nr:MBL fold metallo-hydrolase [Peribacillus deserti]MBM7691202.1 L-ascorbate metabolism protein UlaG (beta-lactamase superfamily) [Peribacillus deserti]